MNTDRERDELYKLARNCAEFNKKGCECKCDKCGYNVYLYTNERDASLIKSNAYADYAKIEKWRQDREAEEFGRSLVPLIGLSLVIGLISWACQACGG